MHNIIQSQAQITAIGNGSGVVNTSAINCSQGFSLSPQTGLCSPVCGEWEEFSPNIALVFYIFTALCYIFHLIGTGIALAFSCYNYKIMQVLLNLIAQYHYVLETGSQMYTSKASLVVHLHHTTCQCTS